MSQQMQYYHKFQAISGQKLQICIYPDMYSIQPDSTFKTVGQQDRQCWYGDEFVQPLPTRLTAKCLNRLTFACDGSDSGGLPVEL